MKINGLDDLSLSLIFDRLPVESLLRAGRVCSRWHFIRGKAALSRKSLILLIDSGALMGIKKCEIRKIPHYNLLTNMEKNTNEIPSNGLNEVMNNPLFQLDISPFSLHYHAVFLPQLFTNVQHLTVSCPGVAGCIILVIIMLTKWTEKMISLKLYSYECIDIEHILELAQQNARLINIITLMPSLKVLHLDMGPSHLNEERIAPFQIEHKVAMQLFEFMKRLTHFHLNIHYMMKSKLHFMDALNMHADGIGDIAISSWIGDNHYRIKPELTNRFSQIAISIESELTLQHFCNRFTNLSILYICFDPIFDVNPSPFYLSISSLKQLIYLHIDPKSEDPFERLMITDLTDIDTLYGDNHKNTSVKVFQLTLSNGFPLSGHDLLGPLCLYHFFPSTKVFVFERFGPKCAQCRAKKLSYQNVCLKRLLASSGMQHQCEVIKTTDPSRKWSKVDLTYDEDDLEYSEDSDDYEEEHDETDNEVEDEI